MYNNKNIEDFHQTVAFEFVSPGEAFVSKRITPNELLELLEHTNSTRFKEWLRNIPNGTPLSGEFYNEIRKLNSDKLWVKGIRVLSQLILGAASFVTGVIATSLDGFVCDKIINGWSPKLFVENVLRNGHFQSRKTSENKQEKTKFYVNPTGRFVIGGPLGDSGLTGRKIIVDTYGGSAPHGGGAFSGKDPTKVDRSAAYAARWVAKNVVAAGLAKKCQVQLAYAIGVARPVSVLVDTFGTGVVSDEKLEAAVNEVFDLRPTAIIRDLELRKPVYRKLAAYGHMGREDLGVTWEKTDRAAALKAALAK